jgi:hypothetical protein
MHSVIGIQRVPCEPESLLKDVFLKMGFSNTVPCKKKTHSAPLVTKPIFLTKVKNNTHLIP